MSILVLNAGSSSQKMHLYDIPEDPPDTPLAPLWAADADWTKRSGSVFLTITARGCTLTTEEPLETRTELLQRILPTLWQGEMAVLERPEDISIVGHRVVHGGHQYQQSVLVTPNVLHDLQALTPFAPLHQPINLEGIAAIEHLLGAVPQIAVFDTAYHCHLPLVAQVYPGPYAWFEQGIRRYGFHGISHQYCARRSTQLLEHPPSALRIVTCHLGNGCSLTATQDGRSKDTTMGFTPLEGLMMGSRSGSIDPGLLLYLQREYHLSPDELDHMLNHESGLKGISGLSSDMRDILRASQQGNHRAQLALDLYIHRLRAEIGAMIISLEGLDVLTFTGGIGEHVPEVRARACATLGFLGITLDEAKNAAVSGDQDIATTTSTTRVLVVHTQEEWEIARCCNQLNRERNIT